MSHPIGTFEATVLEHGLGKASTGTECFEVKFQTDAGTITGWFYLTEGSKDYTIEKALAMGFSGDSLKELGGDCLVGNVCEIVIQNDTYNGKTGPKVQFVNRIGEGGRGVKNDPDVAASIAKQFDCILREKKKTLGVTSAPKKPRSDTDGACDPDDIPF